MVDYRNNVSRRGNDNFRNRNINDNKEIKEKERYFSDNILKISTMTEEYNEYISNAKEYAQWLKKARLTTSQIRKIYSDIIQAKEPMELKRMRPRLAYVSGRNPDSKGLKSFIEVLDHGIEMLNTKKDENEMNSIKEFVETIVAYLKYYGDRG